jgi:hypothetical protein
MVSHAPDQAERCARQIDMKDGKVVLDQHTVRAHEEVL